MSRKAAESVGGRKRAHVDGEDSHLQAPEDVVQQFSYVSLSSGGERLAQGTAQATAPVMKKKKVVKKDNPQGTRIPVPLAPKYGKSATRADVQTEQESGDEQELNADEVAALLQDPDEKESQEAEESPATTAPINKEPVSVPAVETSRQEEMDVVSSGELDEIVEDKQSSRPEAHRNPEGSQPSQGDWANIVKIQNDTILALLARVQGKVYPTPVEFCKAQDLHITTESLEKAGGLTALLEVIESRFKAQEIPIHERVKYMRFLVNAPKLVNWLNATPKVDEMDWEKFKLCLQQQAGGANAKLQAATNFKRLEQNGSLGDYIAEFRALHTSLLLERLVKPGDEELMKLYFRAGLSRESQYNFDWGVEDSLEEMLNRISANLFLNGAGAARSRGREHASSSQHSTPHSSHAEGKPHKREDRAERRHHPYGSKHERGKSHRPEGDRGRDRSSQPESSSRVKRIMQKRQDAKQCRQCGSVSHFKAQCPHKTFVEDKDSKNEGRL